MRLDEDTTFDGTVAATAPPGTITFLISTPPAHGAITLATNTGAFSYTPSPDYFGTDSFAFSATDTMGTATTATVAVQIDGVDDPPEIETLPDASNSVLTHEVVLPLVIRDIDSDPLVVTAMAQDPAIVDALINQTAQELILRPSGYGASRVQVQVSDGSTTVVTNMMFTVQDVARLVELRTSEPSTNAIMLTNTSPTTTDFELTHNGHHAFSSMDQLLEAVRAQPDEIIGESFERKIWRFIRDNTYHASPVNTQLWMNEPGPLLNSFGWGFCSHVSSVFVRIAAAAGYEARSWELNGHVVPEIRIDGEWRMYDPDIAIYYFRRDGQIASVDDLSEDSTLVSVPTSPIFGPGENDWSYGVTVAEIYGSTSNNAVANFSPVESFHDSRIFLPANARLTYPGRWTDAPTGYDGATPSTIDQFRQARLDLPRDFSGPIRVPWVLWDVQGSGVVRINGRDFNAASQELQNFLVQPGAAIAEIEIIENRSDLALIMLINPLWYDMLESNDLVLTGKDVWAIQVSTYSLTAGNRPPPPMPASMRKPRA